VRGLRQQRGLRCRKQRCARSVKRPGTPGTWHLAGGVVVVAVVRGGSATSTDQLVQIEDKIYYVPPTLPTSNYTGTSQLSAEYCFQMTIHHTACVVRVEPRIYSGIQYS
jgi:hypothetical protein